MTLYTVSTQPQAIYPDGQQAEFAITNNGPWTVLIDNISAIGPGSYSLPPLSTITWDSEQPLWIAAKPPPDIALDSSTLGYVNATVVITANSDSVHAPRGQATVKLSDANKVNFSNTSNIAPIETETFSSLVIDFDTILQSAYGGTPAATFLATHILWYNADGDLTYHDKYYHPVQDISAGDYGPQPQRLTVPVKDSYAVLKILDAVGQVYPLVVRTYGQLRDLPESFHYWVSDVDVLDPFNAWPGLAGLSPDMDQTSDTVIITDWTNGAAPSDLWISAIKPRLLVRIRATAVTAAANLSIYAARFGNSVLLRTVAVPVAAGTNWLEITLDQVPVGEVLKIRSTVATGTTGLVIIWQD